MVRLLSRTVASKPGQLTGKISQWVMPLGIGTLSLIPPPGLVQTH